MVFQIIPAFPLVSLYPHRKKAHSQMEGETLADMTIRLSSACPQFVCKGQA